MDSKERAFAYKVRHTLNQRVENLPVPVINRLAAARKAALACKKKNYPLFAWISRHGLTDHMGHFFGEESRWIRGMGLAIPVIVVVVGLAGVYQSTQQQRINEDAEIEAQIMSEDLPLTAYLDKGFNAYLDHQVN
ncbi:MAG: DUF3619 family protein [Burkholderiaceae bacterium]